MVNIRYLLLCTIAGLTACSGGGALDMVAPANDSPPTIGGAVSPGTPEGGDQNAADSNAANSNSNEIPATDGVISADQLDAQALDDRIATIVAEALAGVKQGNGTQTGLTKEQIMQLLEQTILQSENKSGGNGSSLEDRLQAMQDQLNSVLAQTNSGAQLTPEELQNVIRGVLDQYLKDHNNGGGSGGGGGTEPAKLDPDADIALLPVTSNLVQVFHLDNLRYSSTISSFLQNMIADDAQMIGDTLKIQVGMVSVGCKIVPESDSSVNESSCVWLWHPREDKFSTDDMQYFKGQLHEAGAELQRGSEDWSVWQFKDDSDQQRLDTVALSEKLIVITSSPRDQNPEFYLNGVMNGKPEEGSTLSDNRQFLQQWSKLNRTDIARVYVDLSLADYPESDVALDAMEGKYPADAGDTSLQQTICRESSVILRVC